MKTSRLLIVCRGAAALHALVIVVLSLLPGKRLQAWAGLAEERGLDPIAGTFVAHALVAAALLALAALGLAVVFRRRVRIAPRLTLSRPLVLVLIAYVAAVALVSSGRLRTAAYELALERLPAWLSLAAEHLPAGHTLAYAGLGLLLALGWGRRVALWRLGLLAFALSGAIEAMQALVPGRSPSGWDLLANGIGLAMGLPAGGLLAGGWPGAAFRRRRWSRPRREKGPPRRARAPRSV